MSRARILADYVSSGDELALKAPIAGPTFTGTVGGLGTPVINLGSATGAIPAGVTGGAGLSGSTSLGTVTAGTYNATIGSTATFPAGHIISTNFGTYSNNYFEIGGSTTITYASSSAMTFTATGGNKIFISAVGGWIYRSVSGYAATHIKITHDSNTQDSGRVNIQPYAESGSRAMASCQASFTLAGSASATVTVYLGISNDTTSGASGWYAGDAAPPSTNAHGVINLIAHEIKV